MTAASVPAGTMSPVAWRRAAMTRMLVLFGLATWAAVANCSFVGDERDGYLRDSTGIILTDEAGNRFKSGERFCDYRLTMEGEVLPWPEWTVSIPDDAELPEGCSE